MAILESSPLGRISGKLDNLIIYQRNGQWCVRRRPAHVANRRTPDQVRSRSVFGTGMRLAADMSEVTAPNLEGPAREAGLTAYNLFMRLNKGCFVAGAEGVEVRWEALQLSAGDLAPVEPAGVRLGADGTLRVAFGSGGGYAYNQVRLYAYAPTLRRGELSHPVLRREGEAVLALPADMRGAELRLYLVVRDEFGRCSPTAYAGCVGPEEAAPEGEPATAPLAAAQTPTATAEKVSAPENEKSSNFAKISNPTVTMDNQQLKQEILRLKREKNAVILGHYYQRDEIQELSDYVGDSLALAQRAQQCQQDIIVFCGVHFMAETAKILNPTRKVLLPDMEASCSLAESCRADEFAAFKAQHPECMVISYVNCSAEIKALSDLICTSGNAEQLVRALPEDQQIIFAPDKNLGSYINAATGRQMLLWNGVCTVHDAMQAESILRLRAAHPGAKVVAHPECNAALLRVADFVGSTKAMLGYIQQSEARQFIVATETGILFEMRRLCPDKEFITLADDRSCACDDCAYMKLNTLEKLYLCLRDERPEIIMEPALIEAARRPIVRMLDMSRELGLIK